ncbi:hypothetical protein [Baekduia sp. Peel2402]|uniref:hypothetical protein n=1 Tax=Baekduia sp. Peel2402 TaxID=3458296 RepID=UPI00403E6E7C
MSALPPILRRERLPELVDVADAVRLNLPGNDVIQKLRDAESVHAAMAIPFHVAVFNEYLVMALELLQRDGQAETRKEPSRLMLGQLREALEGADITASSDYEAVMNFVQKLRNSIVHDGAIVRQGITMKWGELSDAQRAIWTDAAGRTPVMELGKRFPLGPEEVRATLAVTTFLVRELNEELGRRISRPTWAAIAVEDWRTEAPDKWSDWERRPRNAHGWARHYYASLSLTEEEIAAALRGQAQ